MTSDYYFSERLLYPEFREIRPEMIVNCEKTLRLRRESVTTSGKSLFLLDSIRQIVVYRSVTGDRSLSFPSPSQSVEPTSPNYKPEEPTSPEKYLIDPSESPLLRNSAWVVNDLARRLRINPMTPTVSLAEAGKLSSTAFSELLLEDSSSVPGGYHAYHERLMLQLCDRLVTVPSSAP
jgi:hypothetical protein